MKYRLQSNFPPKTRPWHGVFIEKSRLKVPVFQRRISPLFTSIFGEACIWVALQAVLWLVSQFADLHNLFIWPSGKKFSKFLTANTIYRRWSEYSAERLEKRNFLDKNFFLLWWAPGEVKWRLEKRNLIFCSAGAPELRNLFSWRNCTYRQQ